MASDYQQIRDAMTGGISESVLRRADNATIPPDPANRDRQEYEAWDAIEGNTPDPPDPLPPITVIPSFDFLSRFTHDEQVELDNAASTDNTIGAGRTNLTASADVDLEGASVSNWLDALVDARVITEERKAELLAPVQPGGQSRSVWK